TEAAEAIRKCDSDGPLMIYVTKLYNSSDTSTFDAFGQILSGSVIKGQTVKYVNNPLSYIHTYVLYPIHLIIPSSQINNDSYKKIFDNERKDELSEVEYKNSDDIGTSHNRLAQNKFRRWLTIKEFSHNASSILEFDDKDDKADKRKQSDCPKVRDIIDAAIISNRIFYKPMVRQSTSNFVWHFEGANFCEF
ncbi:15462_t:CDS:2, partial [Gigaspora margarita]